MAGDPRYAVTEVVLITTDPFLRWGMANLVKANICKIFVRNVSSTVSIVSYEVNLSHTQINLFKFLAHQLARGVVDNYIQGSKLFEMLLNNLINVL
jgi:hypothetical protein